MKNHIYICFTIILTAVFSISLFAQIKNIPPPDTEIAFDKEPAVIKQVQPVYPHSMLEDGLEATVYMKVFIDESGNVVEARSEKLKIIKSKAVENTDESTKYKDSGEAFKEAAHKAVVQWKFSPAQIQEKPVAVWVTIPFRFKLDTKETKTEKDAKHAAIEENVESIKNVIENILKGKEIENAKKYIGKDASLIYNTKTANLLSVLNGEQKVIHLIEGKETRFLNYNIKVFDEGFSALIVLNSEPQKSKNQRIHSIILTKSRANEWIITHWHVSF
jgi:TonB family protein